MRPRGTDPDDDRRFRGDGLRALQQGARDLAWLLGSDYPMNAALALVGDRYALDSRSRLALQRGVMSARAAEARSAKCEPDTSLAGAVIEVDAFNLLITLEVALCGGAVFLGSDGALRDLAGLRGSYHMLPETEVALEALAQTLRALKVWQCHWRVDAPVSHAGDLATRLRAWNERHKIGGDVELVRDADAILAGRARVASSDARVIDESSSWVPLANRVIAAMNPPPWVIALA